MLIKPIWKRGMGSKRAQGVVTPKQVKPNKNYENPACVQVVADEAKSKREAREKKFKKAKKSNPKKS